MDQPKVVIIGGGIAGLCTGVYLRQCGFETEILEMHAIAGLKASQLKTVTGTPRLRAAPAKR